MVAASLGTDRVLGLPPLLPGRNGLDMGTLLLAVGAPPQAWCVALFLQGGGTPIRFNPPPTLVARGPDRRVRNPMLVGVLATRFGLGFLLHSALMVQLWTPVFLVANLIEITRVEQPELEHTGSATPTVDSGPGTSRHQCPRPRRPTLTPHVDLTPYRHRTGLRIGYGPEPVPGIANPSRFPPPPGG